MKAFAYIFTLLLLSSCISGHYTRFSVDEPVRDEDMAMLQPGESGLTECLATLGAPTRVWDAGKGRIAVAYTWVGQGDWGVSVSYNITQFVSVRLSYESSAALIQGVVLIFDPKLQLISMERGLLSEIAE